MMERPSVPTAPRGGLHSLNGRGFLAHALDAGLSPLEWAHFAYDPRRDALGLEPGDLVSWPLPEGQAGHGWVASFTPEGDGFLMRVLVVPAHLRLKAVLAACGDPVSLQGLAPLPAPAEAPRAAPRALAW